MLLAVAKANGLEIEVVHEEPAKGVSPEYLNVNPLGKVPTFQGDDGFVLSECIAIAVYRKFFSLISAFFVRLFVVYSWHLASYIANCPSNYNSQNFNTHLWS